MAFPVEFLDEIKTRITLSDYIGKKVKLVRAGREYKACCPFHNEKTPSFTINDEKQFYHCFGCGAHGNVINFAMRNDGYSFPEAIEILAGIAGLTVPKDTPAQKEKYDKQKRLYELLNEATIFFEKNLYEQTGIEALNYLKNRGFNNKIITEFRLGFAPKDSKALIQYLLKKKFTIPEMLDVGLIKKSNNSPDHYSFFRNRVIFPVSDSKGRIIAFGARILNDGEPKYLNSPDHALFHKGKLLYGLSRARAALNKKQNLIVVEGYTDVIALNQAGYIGSMAPLGTAMTENQIMLLWRLLPSMDLRDNDRDYSPILCFDGDNAGVRASQRAVDRALPMISASQTIRVAYLPSGEDPDSLIKKSGKIAFQKIIDQSKPMIDVLWDLVLGNRKLTTPEEKAAASKAIRQKVQLIRDETVKSLYMNEINKRLSSLFEWKKPTKNTKWNRKDFGKNTNRNNWKPVFSKPITQPANSLYLRERILIALMVNHPQLMQEFEADIVKITFKSPELESLRQQLIELFLDEEHETLDVEDIYSHFSYGDVARGSHKMLSEILSETTYVHAGFARPNRLLEQARHGWISIWNKYLQEQLQTDLNAAGQLWHEDPSDENYTRLMEIRQQMEQLSSKSTEQDTMVSE